MGKLIRAITSDGAVLCAAVDSTDMTARAEQIHESSAVVTAAMGRLMTAASMMGAAMKYDGDSITLRVAGGGPVGSIIAVSDSEGNARVTVTNPVVELPLNDKGKLDVGAAVGTDGSLSVIRDMGMDSEPQTGHSPLVTGEIGDDLTYYFANSEQIPSVCALGVLVNPDLTAAASGGYLLQLLPGADDETIDKIEQNLAKAKPISSMIRDGYTPLKVLQTVLEGFEIEVIDEHDVEYRCDCSKERVERALISLGKDELLKLADEQPVINVSCHFCDKSYDFTPDDIREMIK
ncbi:MAG: Hsp33 family molecular chaperone HslO [Oscillospiraceae bacterium]|nr:Hsp33 family molecular chaperone HslO [Oscillospiraceae bacterium]